MQFISSFDMTILNFIQTNLRNPFLDMVMPFFTSLGNGATLWLAVTFILLCIPKYRRWGITLLCTIIITALFGELLLKHLIGRTRPCNTIHLTTMLIAPPNSFSFPSGHTASSFASAIVLWHMNKKMGIVAILIAALIAFSRLYLFVHYPTDVLGGILLGTCTALAVCQIFKKVNFKKDSVTL